MTRGMDGQQPIGRGSRLLTVHLTSLDAGRPTARERLEQALGPELARKLLFALAPRTCERRAA